jgi:hypothetical protein
VACAITGIAERDVNVARTNVHAVSSAVALAFQELFMLPSMELLLMKYGLREL